MCLWGFFSDKINIWLSRLSKADCPLWVGLIQSTLQKVKGNFLLSDYLELEFFFPLLWTGTEIMSLLGSHNYWICSRATPLVLLGSWITGRRSRDLSASKITWTKSLQSIYLYSVYLSDFPGGSDDKESACNAGDPSSIPGSGRSPGEGNDNPLHYFCLENSMNRETWWATVHRVTKSRTWLSDWHTQLSVWPIYSVSLANSNTLTLPFTSTLILH